MADQLNVGGLSLQDSQHAKQNGGGRSYIPPHARGSGGPPRPDSLPGNGAPDGNSWGPPPGGPPPAAEFGGPQGPPRQSWHNGADFPPPGSAPPPGPPQQQWGAGGGQQRTFDRNAYGKSSGGSYGGHGGGSGGSRGGHGDGRWQDGKHVAGPANQRLERELFGIPNDPSKQSSGINFDKYDDIPVEASGTNVPEAVTRFTNPPLDDHLIGNIELSGYVIPTPVQKYSIPIVMNGRDLMACAQTGSGKTGGFLFPILSQAFQTGPAAPGGAGAAGFGGRQRKAYPTTLILAPTRERASS